MVASPSPATVAAYCLKTPWLWDLAGTSDHLSQQFCDFFAERLDRLNPAKWLDGVLPTVLIAEADPVAMLAGVLAASYRGCPLVLGNPTWAIAEWQSALEISRPHLVWSSADHPRLPPPRPLPPAWVLIPTGGTSGQLRFAIQTWDRMMAAADGFQQHFHCSTVQSLCVLPLYHVSGLMQAMRVWQSAGQLAIAPFAELLTYPPHLPDLNQWFVSLVPTQLQRLLSSPSAMLLPSMQAILLGGAPAWPTLLEAAQERRLPIALTYGMTETAAQVATLHPQQFLAGERHCGQPLPHGTITVVNDHGQPVAAGQTGQITIQSSSCALGYVRVGRDRQPQRLFLSQPFFTDDMGHLDGQGNLHLVGRRGTKIITGGENVFPEEVEQAILSTGLVADVAVVGLPDAYWGEAIAALYVPNEVPNPALPPTITSDCSAGVVSQVVSQLGDRLSRFKHPKCWIAVADLPRNSRGKLDRPALKSLAQTAQHISASSDQTAQPHNA